MVLEHPANSVGLLINFPDHVMRKLRFHFCRCLIHVPLLAPATRPSSPVSSNVGCMPGACGQPPGQCAHTTGAEWRYSARHSAMRQNAGVERVTTLNDVRIRVSAQTAPAGLG